MFYLFLQTDSLAPVENILRIVLECKELLNELKVNPPSRIASANCEKDVEVGIVGAWRRLHELALRDDRLI